MYSGYISYPNAVRQGKYPLMDTVLMGLPKYLFSGIIRT